jgi:type IV pilus assembly protein PilY1
MGNIQATNIAYKEQKGNNPAKRIPRALVGKVIPALASGVDVYAGGCKDKVWFGTSSAGVTCDTAGGTDSGKLNPTVATGTVTVTITNIVTVPHGDPAPSGGVFLTTTWVVSNPLQTTTVAPTAGPVDFTPVTVLGSGTGTTVPPGYTAASTFVSNLYTLNGGTSTTAPVSPIPTTIVGTATATFTTRYLIYPLPAPSGSLYRTFSLLDDSSNFCRTTKTTNPSGFKGLISGTSASSTTASSVSDCSGSAFASYPSKGKISGTSRTVYELWDTRNVYALYDTTPVYRSYTIRNDYSVYNQVDQYEVSTSSTGSVSGTTTGVINARVRVCDDTEKTTRTDLCERYPDGNYKPIGEVQRYSVGVRIAAFGYLAENGNGRYGGVLRAPMKYPGPAYNDPNGQPQVNPAAEWDADSGVFKTDHRVPPRIRQERCDQLPEQVWYNGSHLGLLQEQRPGR